MASLHRDKRSGNYIVMFRWEGRQYRRSTETSNRADAKGVESRIEDTIRLLKQGRIEMPNDADPGTWIVSDGKINNRVTRPPHFSDICDEYLNDQADKAETTIDSERTHIRHFKDVFGRVTIDQINTAKLKTYAKKRRATKYRGKQISGKTVRKELLTFRQIWEWARRHKYIKRECPLYDDNGEYAINLPKPAEKERFQTWEQIERRIKRGAGEDLWDFLFLDDSQVVELLKHVREHARYGFIHPMFTFAAYTGARRSEILRSEVEDFDFETRQVQIRERKRRKKLAMTFRSVPLHPTLIEVMQKWFAENPDSLYTIPAPLNMPRRKRKRVCEPVSRDAASHHFTKTLDGSKWQVVRGFHVLRHSFGSNLARSGKVTRATIASWMGHTTQEMMDLYQHLFEEDWEEQISVLA